MSETETSKTGPTRKTDIRFGGDGRMGWPGAFAAIFICAAIVAVLTGPEIANSFEPCVGQPPVSFTRFPDGHEVTICR